MHTNFEAMPTNEGKLDHAAVRYALHKYFGQRHHWYVRGLSDVGKGFQSQSGSLQGRVEEFVQNVLEQKLVLMGLTCHWRGASVHDHAKDRRDNWL